MRSASRPATRRLQIGVRIIGQALQLPAGEIIQKEIGEPSYLSAEHDPGAVGRPRRIEDLTQCRERDLLHQVAVIAFDDAQRRLAGHYGAEDEAAAVSAPG